MAENTGRPLTKEEADQAVSNMNDSMRRKGWWSKVCIHCDRSVGGRLAEYGKPTPADLKYVCCPRCGIKDITTYDGSEHIRLEFVEAVEK